MKRILVTGAGGSAASNFITSLRLAKEKFYIIGTDVKPYHLELSNVDKKYLLPLTSDPSYIKKLNSLIKKERIDLVHPQPDPEVLFLSRNRSAIKSRLFLPSKETIEICQNKISLINLLKQSNVSVGESYLIENEKVLKERLAELLKSHKKVWLRAIRGAGSKASLPVNSFGQAKSWILYWKEMKGLDYGDFMVTEFLPGKEFAFQSIWQNGKLITSQARERVEYIFGNLTPSGQTSSPSVARTVHRADVNKIATETVLAVDRKATGIFCVDMKENKKGIPCVTEINAGRFFTTSNFFATAGSNMPYYYIRMSFDKKLPKLPSYNPIPENWYWVRMIDMGYKLIKGEKWQAKLI